MCLCLYDKEINKQNLEFKGDQMFALFVAFTYHESVGHKRDIWKSCVRRKRNNTLEKRDLYVRITFSNDTNNNCPATDQNNNKKQRTNSKTHKQIIDENIIRLRIHFINIV